MLSTSPLTWPKAAWPQTKERVTLSSPTRKKRIAKNLRRRIRSVNEKEKSARTRRPVASKAPVHGHLVTPSPCHRVILLMSFRPLIAQIFLRDRRRQVHVVDV